jgi:Protein of unknown function (DUF1997)
MMQESFQEPKVMQANSAEHQPFETTNSILGVTSNLMDGSRVAGIEESACQGDQSYFHGYYASCMEIYADAQTVMQYMDAHRDWFHRCAHPMKVEPLGDNGYALAIGRFGAFGYDVEPKIGLDLLPQDQGVYCIQTIPVPNYEAPGYCVDFQASMRLIESQADAGAAIPVMTRVEWELNLEVAIHFPRFIQALPKSMVQTTGDRLLNQIVRQVSRRLTYKVQEDFHNTLGIAFPRKTGKKQH